MKKYWLRIAALITLALAASTGIVSCSKNYNRCVTDKVITQAELRAIVPFPVVYCADQTYQAVNPAFATDWDNWTDKVISYLGATSVWRAEFDCNRFTTLKLAVISVRYVVDTFHLRRIAQAPAAGEIWYIPARAPVGSSHSAIITLEDSPAGPKIVYRDTYSANELKLTPAEVNSIFFIRF